MLDAGFRQHDELISVSLTSSIVRLARLSSSTGKKYNTVGLGGQRDLIQLTGLDEEERTIVAGIEDPLSLRDLTSVIDPDIAGPSMASIIHDAANGNSAALDSIKALSKLMVSTAGDFPGSRMLLPPW